ncbi:hypothetical protein [Corynebacterium lactis]|uniref:DUF1648 domain-containing protein n=1 Tax=Corynebacterium lactis RW2-5 TaxID=1408189 RepID=A0A0K2H398_9CORY|nr:hypothetical protein [Corynebacterium lactis]ALA68507.1 hypothetical protein CLAC_05150 [Corynebacterium lactis RW2-5]
MSQIPRFDPWIIRGTIIVPSVLAVAHFAWILAIAHRLPTRMATHWDAGVTIPQLDLAAPSTASIGWGYAITGPAYTVVVPDGMAEAVAGDINSRLDAARS